MDISQLLTGGIGSTITSSIAKMLNIDESKAKWVVGAAVPLMIAALNYNAKNKGQAASIDNALNQHAGGGIFDNLAGLLSGGGSADGSKIVGHMFGNNTGFVTDNLSQKSGLSSNQVGTLLSVLAPVVMGVLGQQKQAQSGGGGGLGDLIGSVLGGGGKSSGGAGGLLGGLLGSVLGGGKQQAAPAGGLDIGGLADLAGTFFNKGTDSNQRGNVLDSLAGFLK